MRTRYSPVARVLHWLTVLLVVVMFVLGIAMVYLVPDSAEALSHRLYNTHESLGVVVLLVMLLRLVRSWPRRPVRRPGGRRRGCCRPVGVGTCGARCR